MSSLLERADTYFRRELWRADLAQEPFWRAWPLHLLRCVAMAIERGIEHQLPIRASALTFITVLSLVPSLAFAFSVAKSLGTYETVRNAVVDPFLEEMFVTDDVPEDEGRAGPVAQNVEDGAAEQESGAIAGPSEDESADASDQPTLEEQEPETAQLAAEGGQQLRVAIEKVLEFVENTDVKRLGALGFLVVAYAVIRLLGGVEAALNAIWNVARPRRVIRKVTDYLTIVLVAPALAIVSTTSAQILRGNDNAILTFLRDDAGLGNLVSWLEFALPTAAMWLVMTLVYLVMPNTRVKVRSAAFGGLVAALLWWLVQEVHVKSQVGVASYNALYAGFAAFPIFLLWLWFSWLVVLAGAEFGYADQHARAYRRQALAETGNQAWYEFSVLRALGRIVGSFQRGEPPPSVVALVDDLGVPESQLETGLQRLESAGLLLRAGDGEDCAYALARPADEVSVHDALSMLRGQADTALEAVDDENDARLREAYRDAVRAGGTERTLADVAPTRPTDAHDEDASS